MNKWIVDIKGKAESEAFEISVLREDNSHGKKSYGWFDKNKLLISHSGGPCHNKLSVRVWDKLIKVANEVAEELNVKEGLI